MAARVSEGIPDITPNYAKRLAAASCRIKTGMYLAVFMRSECKVARILKSPLEVVFLLK